MSNQPTQPAYNSPVGEMPKPAPAIIHALSCLKKEEDTLTGQLSELFKRLQPVLRQGPADGKDQCPPNPSCNCRVADEIYSTANALSRLSGAITEMVEALEV